MMISLFIGKVTGQVRSILIGQRLGFDTLYADGFSQGFLLTDFIFALLIGGSIQSAIVPYLSRGREKDEEKAWGAISNFIFIMSFLMLIALGIIYFFSKDILVHFTSEDSLEAAVLVSRYLLPQALFMLLAGFFIGILNSYRYFIASSLLPSLYNVLVCFCIYYFADQNLDALRLTALGISFSAFLYFAIQLWITRKKIVYFRPKLSEWEETKQLFKIAFPTLISSAIPQLATFVISAFYALYPMGTAYAYSNAGSLGQLPFGIFALAIGNMFLPRLSATLAYEDRVEEAKLLVKEAFQGILLTILPSVILMIAFKEELVVAIFRWSSAMRMEHVHFTAEIMVYYAVMLIFLSLNYIINLIFYAQGQTKVSLAASVLNVVALFGFSYAYAQIFQLGPASMAMAMASAHILQFLFLSRMFAIYYPHLVPKQMTAILLKLGLMLLVLSGFAYLLNVLLPLTLAVRKWMQIVRLAVKGLGGLGIFWLVAYLWGLFPRKNKEEI